MNKIVLSGLLTLGLALPALANEHAATTDESSDTTTRNPITGTVTRKKKRDVKRKRSDGSESNVKIRETTKTKTNGSTSSDVNVEKSSTSPQ